MQEVPDGDRCCEEEGQVMEDQVYYFRKAGKPLRRGCDLKKKKKMLQEFHRTSLTHCNLFKVHILMSLESLVQSCKHHHDAV